MLAANPLNAGQDMFPDTPQRKNRHKGKLVATALFALALLMTPALGLDYDFTGRLLAMESTLGTFVLSSVVLIGLFAANIYIVSLVPRIGQTLIVWAELFACLTLFLLNFNLSPSFMLSKLPVMLMTGALKTLGISLASIMIASAIAFLGAIAKLSQNGMVSGLATFYTSLFRGIPLLMQIYLVYMGLPQLGYVIDALPAGIVALSLCYGAYMTEIVRAGIESISRGQWEAARSLGLSPFSVLTKVILPQAIPLVIPSIGNQYISMLKDSSLVSVIGIWELMYLSRNLGSKTFQHLEMLVLAAMIYWLMSIVLEFSQRKLELKFSSHKPGS